MKKSLRTYYWQVVLLTLFLLLCTLYGFSFAAEETGGSWRETYDLVMRWVNFIIFAAIIVKLGGKPIKAFVGQQQKDVSTEIELLEKEKQSLEEKVDQTLKMGEESKGKLEKLKERILVEGQRRKDQILEDAKSQSVLMIEESKRKIEYRITAARKSFRQELIDVATEIALEKLPKAISKKDQDSRLKQFMSAIETS